MELKNLIDNLTVSQLRELKGLINIKLERKPKGLCECGKEAKVKEFCINCYNKYRFREKSGYKKPDFEQKNLDNYNQVLELVKSGLTIQNACKSLGKGTSQLYKKMTPDQKKELYSYKVTTCYKSMNSLVEKELI
ncbi:MAG: hypothetical protein WAT79_08580 [Saprospiraceae bacterium]